jgi:predicted porin
MNKKLMALAVAGALTAPGLAVAQVGSSPGVTLYGRIESAIMVNTYSAVKNAAGVETTAELKKGDVFQPGNAMGVRGREDLGGGTALWFQLETGVWTERLDSAASSGQHFGGRNSAIGVSSGWGDVLYGLWDNPYKVAWGAGSVIASGQGHAGIIVGNGDTTGALPNAKCTGSLNNGTGSINTTAGNVCTTELTGGATQWSRRTSNSIQWWSPVFSGLQFKLGTAVANYQSASSATTATQPGTQIPKFWSGSVQWARGPFTIAGAYESHEGFRQGTSATAVANPKDSAFALSGKWNFGPGQVGVIWEQLEYANIAAPGATDNGVKQQNIMLNGTWNVGPGAIWAGYSMTDGGKDCTATAANASGLVLGCGADGEATVLSLGYDYILSKRTKLIFAYAKIDNSPTSATFAGSAYYYIAGPAGNNPAAQGQGTASGIQPSTDTTTLAFGIQHVF